MARVIASDGHRGSRLPRIAVGRIREARNQILAARCSSLIRTLQRALVRLLKVRVLGVRHVGRSEFLWRAMAVALRRICEMILPHFTGSQSGGCRSKSRCHEFSSNEQLLGIALRHATDIAVLEGTTTGPLDYLANSLLLPCRNAPGRRQEFIPEPVELRIAMRSVPIVAGRR